MTIKVSLDGKEIDYYSFSLSSGVGEPLTGTIYLMEKDALGLHIAIPVTARWVENVLVAETIRTLTK